MAGNNDGNLIKLKHCCVCRFYTLAQERQYIVVNEIYLNELARSQSYYLMRFMHVQSLKSNNILQLDFMTENYLSKDFELLQDFTGTAYMLLSNMVIYFWLDVLIVARLKDRDNSRYRREGFQRVKAIFRITGSIA